MKVTVLNVNGKRQNAQWFLFNVQKLYVKTKPIILFLKRPFKISFAQ